MCVLYDNNLLINKSELFFGMVTLNNVFLPTALFFFLWLKLPNEAGTTQCFNEKLHVFGLHIAMAEGSVEEEEDCDARASCYLGLSQALPNQGLPSDLQASHSTSLHYSAGYFGNILHIVHRTLYTSACTLYTVHCTLYTVNGTLYTVHCTLYTVLCVLYTAL